MGFDERYTTLEKINFDTKGEEAQKEIISRDAFAVCEMIQVLVSKLEQLRSKL